MKNDKRKLTVDELQVHILDDRKSVGKQAAAKAAEIIKEVLTLKNEVRIIFAAAPSQNEFLEELSKNSTVNWSKVVAFHMDEYIGLPADSSELFSRYLTDHIFSKANFKKVYFIDSQTTDYKSECERYERLLKEAPIDIVFMGIGENGHIAFNDPPVADFNDHYFVKIIELDEKDKAQQVNDAGFKTLEEVPSTAYTLTVPALMSAKYLIVVVPGIRKAEAVYNTIHGPVSTVCPASILRKHQNFELFLDADSSSLL